MKYEVIILLMLSGMVAADCTTSWVACTNNITLPTNDLSGGSQFYVLDLNSIMCNATYCGSQQLCKNAKGECLVNDSARNVEVFITNSTDTTNGATYTGPQYYDQDETKHYIIVKRITCLSGCPTISSTPTIKLCVNNTIQKISSNSGPVGSPDFLAVRASDFNMNYNRYWTFRDDVTNNLYNFSLNNSGATLTAWCDSYTQATFNLTTSVNPSNSLWINTLQQPKFFLNRVGLISRIREDSPFILGDNYYVQSQNGLNYTFILVDYTGGQFYKSTLTITENVNDSIGNIYVAQFDQSNIIKANLRPNTQYSFKVTSSTSTRDLGAVYLDGDTLQHNVVVSRPDVLPFTSRWDGLNISITSNYDTQTITCAILSTTLVDASLSVFSTNTTPYTLIAVSNASSVLSSTLTVNANRSIIYYAKCFTSDSVYGVRERTQQINFQNTSQYYGGFGSLTVPDTIFGVSKTKFLNIASVAVALTVAGLFSAVSMGTGAVVFGVVIGLFYFIGYFITSPMTIGLIIFLAIMIKLSENRFGVVT